MLSLKQIEEIREHLERAQNPLFYYDNDADGLCAFILFKRMFGRGKGVAVRSYPNLDERYARKASELKADYVFVLDKPLISREFIEEMDKLQIPLVWIDHHDVSSDEYTKEYGNFYCYNPNRLKGKEKSDEPVSYIAYKTAGKKEDIWIALMGCISDHYLPDFADEFGEKYGELWAKNIKKPFDAYFKTEIGRIARALNFGLKDSVTNVVHLQNFLASVNTPGEIFSETKENSAFRKKYLEIRKKYNALLEKAKTEVEDKMVFFVYSGDLSISSDLANELCYLYPEKYVVVAFQKGPIANISFRGKNAKKILDKIIKEVENMTGGGHEEAVGARIQSKDLDKFKEILEREIEAIVKS